MEKNQGNEIVLQCFVKEHTHKLYIIARSFEQTGLLLTSYAKIHRLHFHMMQEPGGTPGGLKATQKQKEVFIKRPHWLQTCRCVSSSSGMKENWKKIIFQSFSPRHEIIL